MNAYHVFLKISFAGKTESARHAVEVPLALVVDGPPVVLQRALVAERRAADITVEHLTGVRGQHMPRKTGLSGEFGLARRALVGLVRAVGLHVSC